MNTLDKLKRETAIASTQAAKAAARVQKETQSLPTSNNGESAVKMSFDDFFASESEGNGHQSSMETTGQTETPMGRCEDTSGKEVPKNKKETTGGGTEMDALPSKFSAWLANSANKINNHLKSNFNETIDERIHRSNELLKKADNMTREYDKVKAVSENAVKNFWVIFEASEKRRLTTIGDSLRRICISGCSKFAS